MYQEYFGLKEKPFSLTPDPRFLYMSESHRKALDYLIYGIREREGFILIVGDIGTGKTTICRELLEKLGKEVSSALILNPMLSERELIEAIIQDFGIGIAGQDGDIDIDSLKPGGELYSRLDSETQAALDLNPMMPGTRVLENIMRQLGSGPKEKPTKKELIDILNNYLLARVAEGGNAALIIDEAQNLSEEVLEQIRILSNLETTKEKLIQIILVGQLELKKKLESPSLRQLNQRISVRYQIHPLTREETKRYIEHRLFVAGSNGMVVITDDAHEEIFEYSRGVPRLINLICERSMLGAYVDQVNKIDGELVRRCRESLESNLEDLPEEVMEEAAAVARAKKEMQENGQSAVSEDENKFDRAESLASEDAVDQPWERNKKAIKIAASIKSKKILAGLAALAVLIAATGIFLFSGDDSSGTAKTDKVAASAPENLVKYRAIRLAYSIQLSAFPVLEDCREQKRLLAEMGLDHGTYIVPLHRVNMGGRWYRLFYGGFPSTVSAQEEVNSLAAAGYVRADVMRVVETPYAFSLGEYTGREVAKEKIGEYERNRIPAYSIPLEKRGDEIVYRLYSGAFENRDEASFLGDRLTEENIPAQLVERLGIHELEE